MNKNGVSKKANEMAVQMAAQRSDHCYQTENFNATNITEILWLGQFSMTSLDPPDL